MPSSLRSLLAARLDLLDPAERRVLERAAVEGEVFHRGAVQALAPEETQVTPRLAALVRRQLIRPDTALFARDDGFRFRHLLIRDTAYDEPPESHTSRAARTLRQLGRRERGRLVELDEILGYHLEQAARYASELGHPDLGLAERAAGRLAAAGYGAAWRGDYRAAERLLERALELTRPSRLDVVLELALALTVSTRDEPAAVAIAEAAADRAEAVDDDGDQLLAQFGLLYQRAVVGPDAALDELEQLARKALPLLKEAENDAGLAYIWFVLGSWVANGRGRYEDYEHAVEQTLHHSRLAGVPRMGHVGEALVHGPRPADEALHALDALLPDSPHPWPHLCRAWLLTMLGRYDEAAPILREQGDRFRELTGDATVDFGLGGIAATRGDHEAAAVHLRRHCDLLEARGDKNYLSDKAPMLGRSLCMLGRHDEAEPLAQRGRERAAQHDAAAQTMWRQVQALVDAHYGRHNRAEQLAREAVAIAETTDAPTGRATRSSTSPRYSTQQAAPTKAQPP